LRSMRSNEIHPSFSCVKLQSMPPAKHVSPGMFGASLCA
jgi:hypothetical protein